MYQTVIVHADLNHCYAQIEEMKYPELRDVPMAVGGHEESRHGIILAKNDKARAYKIKTGESLRDAYKKCPDLLVVPPNFDDYVYYTEKVKDIYREYTDCVESFGLDEAWFDLSASQQLYGDGVELAKKIQERIYRELGLTVSMGVSYNKIFAKLGSDLDKKMGFSVIMKDNFKEVVWPLPVEDLLYVGRATKSKLNAMNIFTIGDLAKTSIYLLKDKLGKMGEVIWCFANGLDVSEVAEATFRRDVKSVGNGVTAVHDLYNYEQTKLVFFVLVESVASRLKDEGVKGSVITIGLRNKNLEWITRQRKIEVETNISSEIMTVVLALLKENYSFEIPLRSISVSVSGLVKERDFVQMNLFCDEEKREELKVIDETIDRIRNKYGFHSIKRASLLLDEELTDFNPKGDHTIHPVGYF